MQLAHAPEQALAGLRVLLHGQGGVLLGDLAQDLQEFLLLGPGVGFDGEPQHRGPCLDPLQRQHVAGGAQGVAGGGEA